jgi:hypothetical protein
MFFFFFFFFSMTKKRDLTINFVYMITRETKTWSV